MHLKGRISRFAIRPGWTGCRRGISFVIWSAVQVAFDHHNRCVRLEGAAIHRPMPPSAGAAHQAQWAIVAKVMALRTQPGSIGDHRHPEAGSPDIARGHPATLGDRVPPHRCPRRLAHIHPGQAALPVRVPVVLFAFLGRRHDDSPDWSDTFSIVHFASFRQGWRRSCLAPDRRATLS